MIILTSRLLLDTFPLLLNNVTVRPGRPDIVPSQLFHSLAKIIRGVITALSCLAIKYADEPEYKSVNEVSNRLVPVGQRFSV